MAWHPAVKTYPGSVEEHRYNYRSRVGQAATGVIMDLTKLCLFGARRKGGGCDRHTTQKDTGSLWESQKGVSWITSQAMMRISQWVLAP